MVYTGVMTTRPVLRNTGAGWTLSVRDEAFSFTDFPEARQALEISSRPEVTDVFPCGWLVEASSEDGPIVVPCTAVAFGTDRGFTCLYGHGHVNAEVRAQEGWDYVDDDEAEAIRTGAWVPGFDPVPMNAGQISASRFD